MYAGGGSQAEQCTDVVQPGPARDQERDAAGPFLHGYKCSRQVWVGIGDGLSKMSDRLLTSTAAANQTTTTGLHERAVIDRWW